MQRQLGDGVVRAVLDDTVAPKKGEHVFGIGSHVDAVRSTKAHRAYSTLVLWFAEGVHESAIATPPCRPWYRHKRGLAFTDVLRAAQRALEHVDILDPANHSEDLQQLDTFVRQRRPPTDREAA